MNPIHSQLFDSYVYIYIFFHNLSFAGVIIGRPLLVVFSLVRPIGPDQGG